MRHSKLRLKITGSFSCVKSIITGAATYRGSEKGIRLLSVTLINLAVAASLSTAIGLVGCSSTTTPKEPEAKELVAASSKATDAPEQELLSEAQRHFASGLYSVARESFERLRDSYPSGSYREFAEIKIADCYFESGGYDDASRRYEEFYRNYPASTSVTYAIFKAARSHQLAFRGVGRDPSPLEKSLEIYNNLLNNYPENSLTAAAKGFRAEVQQLLAEGERNVSEFYSSAGNEDAAEVRMRQFERKQKELAKGQPKAIGRTNSASANKDVTAADEGDEVGSDGESANGKKKIAPPQVVGVQVADKTEAPPSASSKDQGRQDKQSSGSSTESGSDLAPATLKITRLDCKESGERSVVFYLSRSIPEAEAINQSFSAKKRVLELQLPVEEAVPAVRSCFGDRDLALTESGELAIRGPSGADLMAMNHPPRLVLVLRYPPTRPRFAR